MEFLEDLLLFIVIPVLLKGKNHLTPKNKTPVKAIVLLQFGPLQSAIQWHEVKQPVVMMIVLLQFGPLQSALQRLERSKNLISPSNRINIL